MQSNRLQKTYAQQARGNGWVGAPAPQFSLKKVRYGGIRRVAALLRAVFSQIGQSI